MRPLLLLPPLVLGLAGCGAVPGTSTYGCGGLPEGVSCMSAREVYKLTDGGKPVGHPGIVDGIGQAIGRRSLLDPRFQLNIDGNRLRAPAFFVRHAAMALKFKSFDHDPFWHFCIFTDGGGGVKLWWRPVRPVRARARFG